MLQEREEWLRCQDKAVPLESDHDDDMSVYSSNCTWRMKEEYKEKEEDRKEKMSTKKKGMAKKKLSPWK